ncbi:MAG TPA: hypothetical protein VE981_05155 [Planctomycetota bacterium]|nr:hypothetical protein [Planctomycetota bacterium]
MSGIRLSKGLAAWVESTLNSSGDSAAQHCFELRPRFRIPGSGRVDLLSVRHEKGTPDHFRVDLWTIVPGAVVEKDVDAMTRSAFAFQAWYAELMEHAETQGFTRGHLLSVRGNLVGASVRRSPLIDLLSHWGSGMFFWTWTRAGDGIEVIPAYDKAPALGAARAQLKALLPHLSWRDVSESGERMKAGSL